LLIIVPAVLSECKDNWATQLVRKWRAFDLCVTENNVNGFEAAFPYCNCAPAYDDAALTYYKIVNECNLVTLEASLGAGADTRFLEAFNAFFPFPMTTSEYDFLCTKQVYQDLLLYSCGTAYNQMVARIDELNQDPTLFCVNQVDSTFAVFNNFLAEVETICAGYTGAYNADLLTPAALDALGTNITQVRSNMCDPHGTSSSGSTTGAPVSTTTTTGAGPSCSASLTSTLSSTWEGGGQILLTVVNTGTQTIIAVEISITESPEVYNLELISGDDYDLAGYAFPFHAGVTFTGAGLTYSGLEPVLTLESVIC